MGHKSSANDKKLYVSVIGSGKCKNEKIYEKAVTVGKLICQEGGVVVSGGKSGVMKAASRGAKIAGGSCIGILPEPHRRNENRFLDYSIPTGLGQARNLSVILCADFVIAISGSYGTLSEIALAQKHNKPVILLDSWPLKELDYTFDKSLLFEASSPEEAIEIGFSIV